MTSAKKDFLAGADLVELRASMDAGDDLTAMFETFKGNLRRLETLGRPVVAAINGTALGGGFEIALACHHRIALDGPKIRIGLPEVQLGLLPGGGGVTRLVRLLGLQSALTQHLLTGARHRVAAALEAGLVDETVTEPEALLPAAIAWITANPAGRRPVGRRGLPDARRHARQPEAGGDPAVLRRHPAQADRQCPDARAQGDPRGSRRGRQGRRRHRLEHRDALRREPPARSGGPQHGAGLLLRHAALHERGRVPRRPTGPPSPSVVRRRSRSSAPG
ncbi:enoyl-CoA hydratase/isomerase family protein [Janibacter limosus]|uniref:enoyl-CoA hydratase/isomerase family protein n=1 Tax=Janibacter limosus TaxID=53458 RepID=UPI00234316DE|nr:enoyl-CoA hydratase/isomerase family protein [Janibacter limosus]WKV16062.1 enoyl-CoA hydratase/isomerase family protein [Janibacter limosus]